MKSGIVTKDDLAMDDDFNDFSVVERELPGSYEFAGKKHQVMCACNDNWERENRKMKTRPLLLTDIDLKIFKNVFCNICKMAPHIIVKK